MTNRRHAAAAVGAVVLTLGGVVSARSQTSATTAVTVAVLDDYPAFRPRADQSDPRAREMKAIILRRDPTGRDRGVILLNPAHANAATLHQAVNALSDCAAAERETTPLNLIVIRATERPQAPAPAISPAIGAKIAELHDQPTSQPPELGSSGRVITIDDVPLCSRRGAAAP